MLVTKLCTNLGSLFSSNAVRKDRIKEKIKMVSKKKQDKIVIKTNYLD